MASSTVSSSLHARRRPARRPRVRYECPAQWDAEETAAVQAVSDSRECIRFGDDHGFSLYPGGVGGEPVANICGCGFQAMRRRQVLYLLVQVAQERD